MNNNLLAIVKRIIAAQGEGILADSQKLKPLFADLAKDEPKAERIAFGRCITADAYNELKTARTAEERRRVKAALSRRIQTSAGIDAASCNAALDLLEAALFGTQSAPQAAVTPAVQTPKSRKSVKLSKKSVSFGIAAGVGAFVGTLVSEIFRDIYSTSKFDLIINISIWGAFMGLGISTGLLIVQALSVKKMPRAVQIIKALLISGISGFFSGGLVQFIFNYTQTISAFVMKISNALCWGVAGMGIGLAAAFYVSNYPPKRAILAGTTGGTIGGIIYVALIGVSAALGTIIGVIVLGFAIGLTISFMEESLREAWLTIMWGKNETSTVSLGKKPVIFGSTSEADVYIAKPRDQPQYPPIRAVVWIENGQVVMEDRLTNQRSRLQNGSQADLGKIRFIVYTRT